MKEINILDKEYAQWVKSLVAKYRQSQVKAAVKVNTEVLRFYWELGRDIVERDAENQYGSRFYASLSHDLKEALQTDGFSERNLRYMKSFYLLYNGRIGNLPRLAANSKDAILPQVVAELFMVPWGHHRYITDSQSAYLTMIDELRRYKTYQLYRDYLENFRINYAAK